MHAEGIWSKVRLPNFSSSIRRQPAAAARRPTDDDAVTASAPDPRTFIQRYDHDRHADRQGGKIQ
jgi:hypothetical protein